MVVVGTVSKSMEALSSVQQSTKPCDPRIHGKLRAKPRGIQLRQLGVIIVPFNRTRPLREDSSS